MTGYFMERDMRVMDVEITPEELAEYADKHSKWDGSDEHNIARAIHHICKFTYGHWYFSNLVSVFLFSKNSLENYFHTDSEGAVLHFAQKNALDAIVKEIGDTSYFNKKLTDAQVETLVEFLSRCDEEESEE